MVSWNKLATPNKYGGRKVKNIFLFGKYLEMKILWRGLFGKGLSRDIIFAKYLKSQHVEEWIRKYFK